jgi:hypothetical protein
MSDSDYEEKIKKKIKRKKKCKDIGDKIIIIKNVEKDSGWMEKWKKGQSPGLIPHAFRILALGGVGRGKTNILKNLFLKHQATKNKFQKLFIITCDPDSQEWLDCEPDIITDEMIQLKEFDPDYKTLCIVDDYEFTKMNKEQQRQLSTLVRFISSHRNVSILLSFQSFFDCPNIARKCANAFIVYKPNSRQESTNIENRCGLEKGTLTELFNTVCKSPYDSIMVDKTIGTPYPLRKNVYEILKKDDYNENKNNQSDSDSDSESGT